MAIQSHTAKDRPTSFDIIQIRSVAEEENDRVPFLVAIWKNWVEVEKRNMATGEKHPDFAFWFNLSLLLSSVLEEFPATSVEEAIVKLKYQTLQLAPVRPDPALLQDTFDLDQLPDEDDVQAFASITRDLQAIVEAGRPVDGIAQVLKRA